MGIYILTAINEIMLVLSYDTDEKC